MIDIKKYLTEEEIKKYEDLINKQDDETSLLIVRDYIYSLRKKKENYETKEISKKENPADFPESLDVARKGGSVAGNARKEIESMTGKPVVSEDNFLGMPEKLKKKRKKLLESAAIIS